MFPLAKIDAGEPPASSDRVKRASSEQSLATRSAEFKAERLRSTQPPQLEKKNDEVEQNQVATIPEKLADPNPLN